VNFPSGRTEVHCTNLYHMPRLIMVMLLLSAFAVSSNAQTKEKVCKLYGSIQLANLTYNKSKCEEHLSDKSCKRIYSSLEDLLHVSLNDPDKFLIENTDICKVTVTHLNDWVFFSVESVQGYYESAKNKIKSLYSRLSSCDSYVGLEISDK